MDEKQSKSAGHTSDKPQLSSSSACSAADEDALSKLSHVMQHVGEFLTPEEEARLRAVKPALKRVEREALSAQGISPPLTTFFVAPQRTANYLVLTGRPEHLIRMLDKDPMIFFKKHEQIIDAAGQIFYNVSPADLISFVCDDDMLYKVNSFAQRLPDAVCADFFAYWKTHHASRGRGGADLVKFTGEHPPQYAHICGVTNTFNIMDDNTLTTQRPLLKNPDGIICWQAPDNQLHWYYANKETQLLEQIDMPQALLEAYLPEYNALAAYMNDMEPMTARRSSNQEHALIQALMQHKKTHKPIRLVRDGIHYRQDGIDFIDTHHDFNRLTNAYLKCIRLYNNQKYNEGNRVWRAELGRVQREVMWLIQRYCEVNRSFWPLADNYKVTPFVRSPVEIYNYYSRNTERIFDVKTGRFCAVSGLGNLDFGFAIYKGRTDGWWGEGHWAVGLEAGESWPVEADLVSTVRLGIDATQNLDDFRPIMSVDRSLGASL